MKILLTMMALLALPAAAAAPKVAIADLPASGDPVKCLDDSRIRAFVPVRGEQRFLMVDAGGRWYRNELRGTCPGLHPNRIVVRRQPMGRACQGDMFELVDTVSGLSSGLCGFGMFTPVDVPKGARF